MTARGAPTLRPEVMGLAAAPRSRYKRGFPASAGGTPPPMIRSEVFPAALRPHPATPCVAVASMVVDVDATDPSTVVLRYRLAGDIDRVAVPPRASPLRTDDLWKHTCLEFFVGADAVDAYVEFNASPSGAWAAYAFDAYRAGMRAHPAAAPRVQVARTPDALTIDVAVAHPFPAAFGGSVRMGVTAVVETLDGALSYWALAHAAARPDFHQRASFVLRLGPAGTVTFAEDGR
jgi:hypothetical protein